MSPALHSEAKAVSATLSQVAEACGKEAVRFALQPLVLVFGVGEAARSPAFWAAYTETLSTVPRESLAAAIKEYTSLPDSEFFPKPGPLKALALKHAEPLYKAAYRAKRAADSLPRRAPTAETLEERQRQAEEIKASLGMRVVPTNTAKGME